MAQVLGAQEVCFAMLCSVNRDFQLRAGTIFFWGRVGTRAWSSSHLLLDVGGPTEQVRDQTEPSGLKRSSGSGEHE